MPLVGENGAGKSTVVKMLAGMHQPDDGQLLIEGQPVVLAGPAAPRTRSRNTWATDRNLICCLGMNRHG
jgi:ABC-type sugar transport system ATPase subunit